MMKVAVIGIGHLGYNHARILAKNSHTKLLCIVDIDDQKYKCAKELSTIFLKNYQEVPEEIDSVFIATPTSTHAPIVEYFLKKGKHVFVEKTICDNIEAAYYLTKLAKKNNLILQIGYIEKFNPAVSYYKRYSSEATLIEMHRAHPFIERCLDVDVILDLMIHDLDLLFYLFKPNIKRIEAEGKKIVTDKLDEAKTIIKLNDNNTCILKANRVSSQNIRQMKVFQKDACYTLDFQQQSLSIGKKKLVPEQKIELLPLEIHNFINWVQFGYGEIDNSAEATMPALELAFKIKKIIEAEESKNVKSYENPKNVYI